MIRAIKDVNSKFDVKIRKGNNELIYYFNHITMKMMNKIFKQVAIKIKNNLHGKEEKQLKFRKTNPK